MLLSKLEITKKKLPVKYRKLTHVNSREIYRTRKNCNPQPVLLMKIK